MVTQLKQIKGEEFISKILEGQTGFYDLEFEGGFSITSHKRFAELDSYLRQHNHLNYPFVLNRSMFRNVVARGLYMPHLQALETDFSGTILDDSQLDNALLKAAKLSGVSLIRTNLRTACLMYADLLNAILIETDLRGADLVDVKNLPSAQFIETAVYFRTRADPSNIRTIKEALDGKVLNTLYEDEFGRVDNSGMLHRPSLVLVLNTSHPKYGQVGVLENIVYLGDTAGEMKVRFLDGKTYTFDDKERQEAKPGEEPFISMRPDLVGDQLLKLYGEHPK